MAEKTSFYKTDELDKVLKKYIRRHGSLSKAVSYMVIGMDAINRIERKVLKEMFTQEEINLMLNNSLSTIYVPQYVFGAVLASAEDEDKVNYEYFEVDKDTLLDKLRNLTVSQQYALVDWLVEMREDNFNVVGTISNLDDWLAYHYISEEKAAAICGVSIDIMHQWIIGKAIIPQEAQSKLNMAINSTDTLVNMVREHKKQNAD